MEAIAKLIRSVMKPIDGRQVLGLFGSYLALIVLGFWLKSEQTHLLGDEGYGLYALVISISLTLLIVSRLGVFISLQVLLAQNQNRRREKELLGAGVACSFLIGLFFVILMALIAQPAELFFGEEIAQLIWSLCPLFLVYPFLELLKAYGSGTNKLRVNMSLNILPKALFLVLLLLWIRLGKGLDILGLLQMNLITSIIGIALILFFLKPSFAHLRKRMKTLWRKTRKFGLHYYSGALANQTTYRLDEICIGHFINARSLGFYGLANMICSPMLLMSQSLSTSLFRRFNASDRIPPQVFLLNSLWLLACVLFFYLADDYLVSWLFPASFSTVGELLFPISLVLLVHGSISPFGFMVAKSQGHWVKRISWAEAIVNVLGNVLLIPKMGLLGAVWASLAAKSVNLSLWIWAYQSWLKRIAQKQ